MNEADPNPHQASAEPQRVIVATRATVFADRAHRFRALAEGHALGDWLRFLGRLSEAQHEVLQAFPAVPLPDAESLRREHPPLPAQSWRRDFAWHDALSTLLDAAEAVAPEAGRSAFALLRQASPDRLEALADQVVRTELYGEAAAALPLVAAGLQVYWTHLAICLGAEGIPPLDVPGICPCCGFLPVASLVRIDGPVENLRYLHCALCNTEWNLVRVKCAACDGTEGIAYRQIEDAAGVVRAETCDSCRSYLKIIHQGRARNADPVADDLATLALDMLVEEAGYDRAGPNLLFVPGEG
jgi:FdhE protein